METTATKYPIELRTGDLVQHDKYTEPIEVIDVTRQPGRTVLVEAITAYGTHVELVVSHTTELVVVVV